MNTILEEPVLAPDFSPPGMPDPLPEHAWLAKYVGEWESSAEMQCDPTQPPMLCTGTESARMLGGHWLVAQGSSDMGPMRFESVLTLGFEPQRQIYIGSWIDSMTGYFWQYEGAVNAAGTTLSLDTMGPYPANPDRLTRFREVTEFKSADLRVFTSSVEGDDGSWRTLMTVHYRRKHQPSPR